MGDKLGQIPINCYCEVKLHWRDLCRAGFTTKAVKSRPPPLRGLPIIVNYIKWVFKKAATVLKQLLERN